MFQSVSTNGVSIPIIQLGAGSVQTSGYLCTATTNGANTQFTTGFGIVRANGASSVHQGSVMFANITGNSWVAYGVIAQSDSASGGSTGGSVSLSGTLDRIRITMENGTDAFDAGTINILYE